MLSDQTWPESLANQSWILCRSRVSIHQKTILAHIVHDHVLKLDVAHVTLLVVHNAYLLESALGWKSYLLVAQSLTLRRVSQRVLLSSGNLFISGLASGLCDVIVEEVRVEARVHSALRLAIDAIHFWHDALCENFIELF